MKIAVVTTLSAKLYDEYGYKFFETYNWPFDLFVYSEDISKIPQKDVVIKNIFNQVPQCKEFIYRNKNKPVKNTGNGYLHDAVRFCYKVYSYTDQIIFNDNYEGLICIDADSIFYNPINVNFIKQEIHKDDCMMSYLGRGLVYSECGFLYFNLKHKDTLDYAKFMQNMYNTDSVYNLAEYHDSYVWDYAREKFQYERGTLNNNIGDGMPGHVQARSVLGEFYDHIKGPGRKKILRSPESRIKKFFRSI